MIEVSGMLKKPIIQLWTKFIEWVNLIKNYKSSSNKNKLLIKFNKKSLLYFLQKFQKSTYVYLLKFT